MRPGKTLLLALLLILPLLMGCRPKTAAPDAWDYTPEQLDSLRFIATHHYSRGYNFKVEADSLMLHYTLPADGGPTDDSCMITRHNRLVVADIRILPVPQDNDSVWIKVARDQMTMGWVSENKLLRAVVPDDPISQFIHLFSDRVLLFFVVLTVAAIGFQLARSVRRKRIRMVHVNDIDSLYPTLLCMAVASAAVLYSTIQMWQPDAWQCFYFHPTLNPFGQSFVLTAFLLAVWSILILLLATVDDVIHKLHFDAALPYLLSLGGFVLVLYLFFTLTTLIYVGYVCLPLYWAFALHRYLSTGRRRYVCGQCGKPLSRKGVCPHCGTPNV